VRENTDILVVFHLKSFRKYIQYTVGYIGYFRCIKLIKCDPEFWSIDF